MKFKIKFKMKEKTYIKICFGVIALMILIQMIQLSSAQLIGGGIIGGSGGAICKSCPKPIEPSECFYDSFDLPELTCNGFICKFVSDNVIYTTRQYIKGEAVSTCDLKKWQYKLIQQRTTFLSMIASKGLQLIKFPWSLR